MGETNTRRIVVLGKTGSGKSSLVNTIFGQNIFEIKNTPISETSKCRAVTRSVRGRSITLIDTPGFFDTDRPEEELKPEIVKCITECSPGPHAFLIVLKVEKFTEHEQAVIKKIEQYFSGEVFKYATLLFTYGDQLDEGQTIEDFVKMNELTSDLVKKCGGRCHVIDNKHWKNNQQDEYRSNNFQVEQLLKTIDTIIEVNKGGCYTNEMLQAVEEEIKQEEERIRQSSRNMSEVEVRKQAKSNVTKMLLIKLAGVATGALLGALCGVVVMVAAVVKVFKKGLSEQVVTNETLAAAAAAAAAGVAAVVAVAAEAPAVAAAGVAAAGAAAAAAAAAVAAETPAVAAGAAAVVAVAVVAGAVKGGVTGYDAAKGANTPWEAAKMAAMAVKNEALSALEELDITNKDKSESKPLMSFESHTSM